MSSSPRAEHQPAEAAAVKTEPAGAEPRPRARKRVSSEVAMERRLRRMRDRATRLVPHEPLMRMAKRMLARPGRKITLTHGAFRLFREFFEKQGHDLLRRTRCLAVGEGRKRLDRQHIETVAQVLGLHALHNGVIDAMVDEEDAVKVEPA